MTARSATPTVAGAELVVWRDGAGDQAPLFVLHGGPGFGSAYLRQPLIDTLGDDLQLFFYDQRGSGYSGGLEDPSGLTMRRLVDDLELLRRRAELETLDLLGHSFGGLLAMHYAIAYPERVGRLVLVDSDPATYALWSQHADRLSGRLSAQDKALIEGLRANPAFGRDPGVMTAWVGLRMRGYTAVPDSADNIDFRLTAAVLENLTTTPGIIRADLGEWDVSGDLSKIRARTLVVAGGDSIFPVSAAEALARGIPNAQLSILPNVGHFPFIEDPDAFRQIVLEFLRQN